MFPELTHFLAQSDSSNVGDFIGQISGLLLLTCGAGIVWMGLMALVFQRASERRRRAAEGLPPLPGLHLAFYHWLTGQRGAPAAAPATASPAPAPPPRQRPASRTAAVPAPDLSLLTGDLPQPDVTALAADDEPEPAADWDEPATMDDLPEIPAQLAGEDESAAAPEPAEAFPVTPAVPAPPPEPAPEAPAPSDAVELLRVWRDLSDGTLVVEIGGRRFQSLAELRSADLERRFLNVVRDLDGLTERPPAPLASAAPVQGGKAPAPKTDDPSVPSMTPGSMLRQMTRAAMGHAPEPVPDKPAISIADQIEDLLQARIADDPAYEQRSIHIKPALDGGVRIEVDGTYYDGVGDVEDEAVRALLVAVVREWEERQ
jgi:hypothetical protein